MGRYTDLTQKHADAPRVKGDVSNSTNVNINAIHNKKECVIDKPTSGRPEPTLQVSLPVEMPQDVASGSKGEAEGRAKSVTTLRPTTLTTLIEDEEVWVATSPDPHRYTKLAGKPATPLRG